MNVYFVRHGESVGNLKDRHQGGDVPLSEKGIKQAKLLADRLKAVDVDIIYASPYLRAKETAKIIATKLGLEIEYWDKIVERKRPSEIEGLRWDNPKASTINKLTRENQVIPDWKYSDDESYNDLVARAESVTEHLFEHHKKQNVLCVSHQGIIKTIVLRTILQDVLAPEVFWKFYYHSWIDNTGITQIKYGDRFGWELVTWNDTTHL
jgi:phosphoserine phosphatase